MLILVGLKVKKEWSYTFKSSNVILADVKQGDIFNCNLPRKWVHVKEMAFFFKLKTHQQRTLQMYKMSDFPAFVGPAMAIVRLIHGYSWKLSADLSRYFVRSTASKKYEHISVWGFGSSGMWVSVNPDWGFSLPWLRFFRAFSPVVRQMPGYNSQRRGTARTLPKCLCCSVYCLCVTVYCTTATGCQPNCN
jgi:hypothetical protein